MPPTILGSSSVLIQSRDVSETSHKMLIVYAILIPVLVALSGLFAGLTLGYMSLDTTQLRVLSISGTPEQRQYANKIIPIRKNGHLLLVTLLLANMVVNESLPLIADRVLGNGIQSVVISTALIVIFAEVIPQSLFTRYGLYLGAKGAGLTRCLMFALGIIAWPVAKLLEFVLGPHHGVIYRRGELKELIAMHSSAQHHGGDLKHDTVTIVNATLDLQEKVVRQAMTPLSDVFMLSIDASLDFDLLKQIVAAGHSRIPVYEEVDLPDTVRLSLDKDKEGIIPSKSSEMGTGKVKRIIGILLVKQCVLLDPKDATPIRSLQLNKVPFVPNNEPLLGILDKFQEGRSHMAIVSRLSVDKAKSVKKAVKRGLTQRLKERVGMGESSSSESSDSEDETGSSSEVAPGKRQRKHKSNKDIESDGKNDEKMNAFQLSNREQNGPADAVLTRQGADEFLQGFDDPAVMPLGIITLEDVLEELIGEEIYDEFDAEGAHGEPFRHTSAPPQAVERAVITGVKNTTFLRSRTAPPRERDETKPETTAYPAVARQVDVSTTATPNDIPLDNKTLDTNTRTLSDQLSTPALEAILLDRKRRLTGGTTGTTATGTIPVAASRIRPGPKGRFKSGPILTPNVDLEVAGRNSKEPEPANELETSTLPDVK